MRQTLFYIPHQIGPLPLFGFGWVLLGWTVFAVILLVYLIRNQGFHSETRGYIPVLLIVGMVIAFLIPALEVPYNDGSGRSGVPIRGYGALLLIAFIAGLADAARRTQRAGADPEIVFSSAMWMFVLAIVGARAFFVIQKWDQEFRGDNLPELLKNVVNVTQGGLVVYGALLGG